MDRVDAIKTIQEAINKTYNYNTITLHDDLVRLKEHFKQCYRELNSLEFYKVRVKELEDNKNEFPEPYYTKICNILANGRIEA